MHDVLACDGQYAAYATVKSLPWLLVLLLCGTVFATLARFSWGRSLLLKVCSPRGVPTMA